MLGHVLAALAGAAAVLALMLPGQAERLERGLPPPVDPAGANSPLRRLITEAEQAAQAAPTVERVATLGRLYHANGLNEAAAVCWRLLAAEDAAEGRWPHYLAQLARIRSDQAVLAQELALAVARDPTYAPAWLQHGDLAFKQGRHERARRAYEQRLQLLPGDPYARLGLARLALTDLDRTAAKQQLLGIVADHPKFSAAHNLLAQLAEEDGQADLARRHRWLGHQAGRFAPADDPWMNEVEASCYDPGRLRILGVRDYQNGRNDRARLYLERAVEVDPDDPGGYEPLGFHYLQMKEYALAEQTLRQAKSRFEQANLTVPLSVFIHLGEVLMATDRPTEAVELLQAGLALHPQAFELHNSLGIALRQADRVADSIASFRAALTINPFDADTNFNLALLLFNRGAREEALLHHRQALKLKPTFAPSLTFLAQHAIAAGQLEEAQPYVERLHDAYAMVPEARRIVATWHWQRGLALRQKGDPAGALLAFETAFELDPEVPGLGRELGNAYLDRGEFAKAAAPLEEFHRQSPQDPQAAMLLAQVYARERRFRDARALLEEAAELATAQGNPQLADFCREILGQLPGR